MLGRANDSSDQSTGLNQMRAEILFEPELPSLYSHHPDITEYYYSIRKEKRNATSIFSRFKEIKISFCSANNRFAHKN